MGYNGARYPLAIQWSHMENVSKRTHSTQMPDAQEIEALLEREARRPVAAGKEDKHFATFDLVIRWLELLDLPAELFIRQGSWQKVVVQADLIDAVAERTLQPHLLEDPRLLALMSEITRYLGTEDTPHPSDEIFVFGGKNLNRIEKGVELYKQDLSPRIFVTGSMPIYAQNSESEAQRYKNWAVENGVPADAIFIHDTAISVADNVRGGLNMLDHLKLPYRSLILVTAWFAMRRSYAMMMKYVPTETVLYRVNAPVTAGGDYDPTLWWKNPNGIKTIFGEFAKLRVSELLNTS